MTSKKHFQAFFLLFISLGLSCVSSSKSQNPPEVVEQLSTKREKVVKKQVHEPNTPLFRLSTQVVPLSYALRLKTDPAKDTFEGDVKITIELKAQTKSFFLHAKHIDIKTSQLSSNAGEIPATLKVFEKDEQVGWFLSRFRSQKILRFTSPTAPHTVKI